MMRRQAVLLLLLAAVATARFSTKSRNEAATAGVAANPTDPDRALAGPAVGSTDNGGAVIILPAVKDVPMALFNTPGKVQYYRVPPRVTVVSIKAWGAGGARSSVDQASGAEVPLATSKTDAEKVAEQEVDTTDEGHKNDGGGGGFVQASFVVTPGEVLEIRVGGAGLLRTGGWNGGGDAGNNAAGGGGGASDVRRQGESTLLLSAGGGGGAGVISEKCCASGGGGGGPEGGSSKAGAAGGSSSSGGAPSAGAGAGASGVGGKGGASGGGGGGGYFGGAGGVAANGIGGGGGGGSSFVCCQAKMDEFYAMLERNTNGVPFDEEGYLKIAMDMPAIKGFRLQVLGQNTGGSETVEPPVAQKILYAEPEVCHECRQLLYTTLTSRMDAEGTPLEKHSKGIAQDLVLIKVNEKMDGMCSLAANKSQMALVPPSACSSSRSCWQQERDTQCLRAYAAMGANCSACCQQLVPPAQDMDSSFCRSKKYKHRYPEIETLQEQEDHEEKQLATLQKEAKVLVAKSKKDMSAAIADLVVRMAGESQATCVIARSVGRLTNSTLDAVRPVRAAVLGAVNTTCLKIRASPALRAASVVAASVAVSYLEAGAAMDVHVTSHQAVADVRNFFGQGEVSDEQLQRYGADASATVAILTYQDPSTGLADSKPTHALLSLNSSMKAFGGLGRDALVHLTFDKDDLSDTSGHKNSAETASPATLAYSQGHLNKGVQLMSGARFVIPSTKVIDFEDKISISVWYKRTAGWGKTVSMLSNGDDATASVNIGLHANDSMPYVHFHRTAEYGKPTQTFFKVPEPATPNAVRDDLWHHLVAVYDGYSTTVYVDGEKSLEERFQGGRMPLRRAVAPLVIGQTEQHNGFVGSLDELVIMPSVLSQADVANIYATNDVAIDEPEAAVEVRVHWGLAGDNDVVAMGLKKDVADMLYAREDRLVVRQMAPPIKAQAGMYFRVYILNGASQHVKPTTLAEQFKNAVDKFAFKNLANSLQAPVTVLMERPASKAKFSRICPCLSSLESKTSSKHKYELVSPAHAGMASGCTAPKFLDQVSVQDLAACQNKCDLNPECNVVNFGEGVCTLDRCSNGDLKLSAGASVDVYSKKVDKTVVPSSKSEMHVCAFAEEFQTAKLSCPGGMLLNRVTEASFGDGSGKCDSYTKGPCHAESSMNIAVTSCVGKSECLLQASTEVFGNPCPGSKKALMLRGTCRSLGQFLPVSDRSKEALALSTNMTAVLELLANKTKAQNGTILHREHDLREATIHVLSHTMDLSSEFLALKTDLDLKFLLNTVRYASFYEYLKANDRSDDELAGMSKEMMRKAFVGELRKVVKEEMEVLEQKSDATLLAMANAAPVSEDSDGAEEVSDVPKGVATSAVVAATRTAVEFSASLSVASHAAARAAAAAVTYNAAPVPKVAEVANAACKATGHQSCTSTAGSLAYSKALSDGMVAWAAGSVLCEAARDVLRVPGKDIVKFVGMAAATATKAVGMSSLNVATHAGLAAGAAKFCMGASPENVEMAAAMQVTSLGGSKQLATKTAAQALSLAAQSKANNPDVTKQDVFDDGSTADVFVSKPAHSPKPAQISVTFELSPELVHAMTSDKPSVVDAIRADAAKACHVSPDSVAVTVPTFSTKPGASDRSAIVVDTPRCQPGDLGSFLKQIQKEHSFGLAFNTFCRKHNCRTPASTKHVVSQTTSDKDMAPSQPPVAGHEAVVDFIAGRTLTVVAQAAFKGSMARGLTEKQAMKNAAYAVGKVAFETGLPANEWARGIVSAVALAGGSRSDATCLAATVAADLIKEVAQGVTTNETRQAAVQAAGDAATHVQLLMKAKPAAAALAVDACMHAAGFTYEEVIPQAVHAAGIAAASSDHFSSLSILDAGHAAARAAKSLGVEPEKMAELSCLEVARGSMAMGATEEEAVAQTQKCVKRYGKVLFDQAARAHRSQQLKLQAAVSRAEKDVASASAAPPKGRDTSPKQMAQGVLDAKRKTLDDHVAAAPTENSIFGVEARRIVKLSQVQVNPTALARESVQGDGKEIAQNAVDSSSAAVADVNLAAQAAELADKEAAKAAEAAEVKSEKVNRELAEVKKQAKDIRTKLQSGAPTLSPDVKAMATSAGHRSAVSKLQSERIGAMNKAKGHFDTITKGFGKTKSPAEVSDLLAGVLSSFGSSGPELAAAVAQTAGLATVAGHGGPADAAHATFEAVKKHGGSGSAAVALAVSMSAQQTAASGGSAVTVGDAIAGLGKSIGGAPPKDMIASAAKGSFEVARSQGGSFDQALKAAAESALAAAHAFKWSLARSAHAAAEATANLGGEESELAEAVGAAVATYAAALGLKHTEAAAAVAAASIAAGAHKEAAAAAAGKCAAQVALAQNKSTADAAALAQTIVKGMGGSDEAANAVFATVSAPMVTTKQLDGPVAANPDSEMSPLQRMEEADRKNASAAAGILANITKQVENVRANVVKTKAELAKLGAGRLPQLRMALKAIEKDKEVDFWRDDVLYGSLLPKSWRAATKMLKELDALINDPERDKTKSQLYVTSVSKKVSSLAQLVFTMQKAIKSMRLASFTGKAYDNYKFNDALIQKADSFAALKIRAAETLAGEFPSAPARNLSAKHVEPLVVGPHEKGIARIANSVTDAAKAESMASQWMNRARNDYTDAADKKNATESEAFALTGPLATAKETLARIHASSALSREAKQVGLGADALQKAKTDAATASLKMKLLHNEVVDQARHKVEDSQFERR